MYSLKQGMNQKEWDTFVSAQRWAQFNQSWDWGAFQESRGNTVRRFFLMQGEAIIAAVQLIRFTRHFGIHYWFAPRGPIFINQTGSQQLREVFITLLKNLLKQEWPGYALFFRFEPLIPLGQGNGMIPLRMQRNHAMNPACTLLLNLTQSEEDLLAQMHPKTRYNIRVAQKHGVSVREGTEKDVESFLDLMRETGERDEFIPQNLAYIKAAYQFLVKVGFARLRVAEHEGIMLSANMEMTYGDTVTYLHGTSSSSSRQLMAPYLLHWEAIRTGKAEGYSFYDWWGLNPELMSNYYFKPSWEGITRFKLGWGGERISLIGTWDLPINRAFYYSVFPKLLWRG